NFSAPGSSFDGYWCKLAHSIQNNLQTPTKDREWNDTPLAMTGVSDSESASQISISSLLYFVRNPAKLFINSRLHIYLGNESLTDDDELFSPDSLQVYLLSQRLLDSDLHGTDLTIQQLKAEGELPHGIFAEPWLDTCDKNTEVIKQALKEYVTEEPQHCLVDLVLEDSNGEKIHLSGELHNIYQDQTLLRYKASKLKGSDILALWLEHLVWCMIEPQQNKKSLLLCRDKTLSFNSSLSTDIARQHLIRYIGLYKKSKTQPLPVFPVASYEYARSLLDKSGHFDPAADIDKALQKARTAWHGNSFNNAPSDKDDPYIQIIMRGVTTDPVLHKDFSLLAKEFYLSALEQSDIHEFY
ncbi:MAG: hypothetical protein OEY89_18880, partial [Gammaproteobacteria bacterium]|nr:hypothetical protein [Gammaproteobacteria bacterium]